MPNRTHYKSCPTKPRSHGSPLPSHVYHWHTWAWKRSFARKEIPSNKRKKVYHTDVLETVWNVKCWSWKQWDNHICVVLKHLSHYLRSGRGYEWAGVLFLWKRTLWMGKGMEEGGRGRSHYDFNGLICNICCQPSRPPRALWATSSSQHKHM